MGSQGESGSPSTTESVNLEMMVSDLANKALAVQGQSSFQLKLPLS